MQTSLETKTWIIRTTDFKQTQFPAVQGTSARKTLIFSSLKKLFLFWAIAALCIFIPVLHFFLVPTFFIVGIFAFFQQMKNTHHLTAGEFTCPACGKNVALQNFFFRNGLRFQCKQCNNQLIVELA